jgi:hypothetical protein
MNEEVFWRKLGPDSVEYEATVQGRACRLRMNNFPEAPLYTLIVGIEWIDLDDAPKSWHFPWKP